MTTSQWNPSLYDNRHSYVWKLGEQALELLEPKAGERILDVGCGTGHLTAKIAEAGADVVGVDASPEMIEQARAAHPGLRFEVLDARALPFHDEFDAVFSNAALHWIKPPEQVPPGIARALRPGGRFAAEFGGKGNVAAIRAGLGEAMAAAGYAADAVPDLWFFPSVGEYATMLEASGLDVGFAALFDRPTPLEGGDAGMPTWLEMFARPLLAVAPEEQRAAIVARALELMRPALFRDGGWFADYRRLRIAATKRNP